MRRLALLLLLPALAGCSSFKESGAGIAGGVGGVLVAQKAELLKPEFLAGALVAYAIYDPLAPTWEINATKLDEDRVRFDLCMKALITGGDGEARQIFLRNARQLAEGQGAAGFDVVRFEEGIDSTRPFAHRFASGEVRLVRSRIWPTL
ncbi:MAG TPA: hypothetical protein VJ673_13320 [Aromatoleum sp.]|uniref:hypothetical protein n=1 Tax=Aromatoleum sp. TaxID=2307007 RepID=UPI002B466044|nr:hypothetical protein [Aromatoleum sp.]HJV26662.1 hypothetical protein [Aromatoleum sp.]